MPRYVNPHLECHIRAMSAGVPDGVPPEKPSMQELRRAHDLGLYTVEELEDLLDAISGTMARWVENHPPRVVE